MREIKFRGMSIDGSWHYGLLSKPMYGDYKGKTFISNSVGSALAYEVFEKTVGQFTGLKDKNGKEIYEGDIINSIFYDHESEKEITDTTEVIWDNGEYRTEDFYPLYVHVDNKDAKLSCEVIGNIHES